MLAVLCAFVAGCASKQDLPEVGSLDDYMAQGQNPDPYATIDPFWLATWYPYPFYCYQPDPGCHGGVCGPHTPPGPVAIGRNPKNRFVNTAASGSATVASASVQSSAGLGAAHFGGVMGMGMGHMGGRR